MTTVHEKGSSAGDGALLFGENSASLLPKYFLVACVTHSAISESLRVGLS